MQMGYCDHSLRCKGLISKAMGAVVYDGPVCQISLIIPILQFVNQFICIIHSVLISQSDLVRLDGQSWQWE